jgi:hypothetical protein
MYASNASASASNYASSAAAPPPFSMFGPFVAEPLQNVAPGLSSLARGSVVQRRAAQQLASATSIERYRTGVASHLQQHAKQRAAPAVCRCPQHAYCSIHVRYSVLYFLPVTTARHQQPANISNNPNTSKLSAARDRSSRSRVCCGAAAVTPALLPRSTNNSASNGVECSAPVRSPTRAYQANSDAQDAQASRSGLRSHRCRGGLRGNLLRCRPDTPNAYAGISHLSLAMALCRLRQWWYGNSSVCYWQ